MTPVERRLIQCARSLASHLLDYAHERRDEDRKAIAATQTELCRIYREERSAAQKEE